MQKIYSLLRNNKQSGPYTLEELLQLSLKHFDLVWVEGKSSGWSYPSEIDTLKTYVDDIPKKAEEATFQSQKSPDSTSATSAKTEIRTKKSTPVSAIAKHVYISLPAGAQKDRAFTPTISSETTEESADAKLERKALELRNKIQAFAANKNKPKEDNELDTKYSRPLDDIKEEYSSWLHQQQKQKKSFPKKPALIISGASILLIGGYFIMSLFSDNKTTTTHILSAEEIKAAAPVFNETNKEIALEQKKLNSKRVTKSSGKNNSNKTKSLSKKFSNETIQVDGYIDSLKRVEKITPQTKGDRPFEPTTIKNDGVRQSTKRDVDIALAKNETESVPFAELVKLSESTGSETPHLSLYNNSNKQINFVAIDVFYYKPNKKLLLKKTLYFKNIAPNSTAKLFVPQEKKASSVEYQMGLISTDNGLYYAKQ